MDNFNLRTLTLIISNLLLFEYKTVVLDLGCHGLVCQYVPTK
jgi:hypothetical protein